MQLCYKWNLGDFEKIKLKINYLKFLRYLMLNFWNFFKINTNWSREKNILGNIGRGDLYPFLTRLTWEINMMIRLRSSTTPLPFSSTVLSRGPPPSVISHCDNISPETWKGTQNYSAHLFRKENGGKGVYGNNLSKLPKMSHRYDYFSVYFNIFSQNLQKVSDRFLNPLWYNLTI